MYTIFLNLKISRCILFLMSLVTGIYQGEGGGISYLSLNFNSLPNVPVDFGVVLEVFHAFTLQYMSMSGALGLQIVYLKVQ